MYKNSDIKGNPQKAREKAKLGKGVKKRKTILKEELGLKSTKDLAIIVRSLGDDLYAEAAKKKDWNKKYLLWKEMWKTAMPKTAISVEKSFEDFLREEEERIEADTKSIKQAQSTQREESVSCKAKKSFLPQRTQGAQRKKMK